MKNPKKTIAKMKVADIKPNPDNAKLHYVAGIKDSLEKIGYVEMINVDEAGVILAGHGRLKSLKELQVEEVEVVVVEGLSAEEKAQYLLNSNQLVIAGGWDKEQLKKASADMLQLAGFSFADIVELHPNLKTNPEELAGFAQEFQKGKQSKFWLWVELANQDEEDKLKTILGLDTKGKTSKQMDKAKLLKLAGLG